MVKCPSSQRLCCIFGFAQASGQSRAAFFVVCRHRRRTHPPARPSSRAQWPVGYPDRPPATGPALGPGARVCVCGCGCSRCPVCKHAWWCLVRICGGTPSYEQRPRDSCSCHWGGRQLSSTPVCAGRPSKLAWRFGSSFVGPRVGGAAGSRAVLHCWRLRGGGWGEGAVVRRFYVAFSSTRLAPQPGGEGDGREAGACFAYRGAEDFFSSVRVSSSISKGDLVHSPICGVARREGKDR
jgi:hypothetical protein